jgi:LPXTG-motif cell wall-anchored protein
MSEGYDNFGYEENAAASRPSNRPFIITMSILGIILILGLAVMAVWVWGQARDFPGGALAFLEVALSDPTEASQPEEKADTPVFSATPTLQPTATLSPAEVVGGESEGAAGANNGAEESAPQATEDRDDVLTSDSTPEPPSEEAPSDVLPDAARTATVSALLTAAAESQVTPEATATELPDTGFVDDLGLPVLGGLALLLVAVIILVRRLRSFSSG